MKSEPLSFFLARRADSEAARRERRIERCQAELEELLKGGEETGVGRRTQNLCLVHYPHNVFLYVSHAIHNALVV